MLLGYDLVVDKFFDLADEALNSDDPDERLATLARQMVSEGDHDAVVKSFKLLLIAVQDAGGGVAREDVVLDLLDRLTGYCGPEARIYA